MLQIPEEVIFNSYKKVLEEFINEKDYLRKERLKGWCFAM